MVQSRMQDGTCGFYMQLACWSGAPSRRSHLNGKKLRCHRCLCRPWHDTATWSFSVNLEQWRLPRKLGRPAGTVVRAEIGSPWHSSNYILRLRQMKALRLTLNFSSHLLSPPDGLLNISYKSSCIRPASRHCTGTSPATGRSLYLSDGFISDSLDSPVHRRRYIFTLASSLTYPRASTWTNTFHRPLKSWSRSSTSNAERGADPAKALASTSTGSKPIIVTSQESGHRQNSGSFAQAQKSQSDHPPLFEAGSGLGRPTG
jgi:hypothetical protein